MEARVSIPFFYVYMSKENKFLCQFLTKFQVLFFYNTICSYTESI